jgi:hypothetical protein
MTNRGSTAICLTVATLCAGFTAACASATGNASAQSRETSASPSASASPSTTPGTSSCTAAQLRVTADGSGAATGHSDLVVEITNQGAATCTLFGFPTVAGTLPSGTVVHGVDTANVFIGMTKPGSGPSPVSLNHGGTAWLPLNFSDNPINGATSCPSFSSFSVTLPGVSQAYTVHAPDSGAGYPPDCDGIKVPPVLAAADAVIPSSD